MLDLLKAWGFYLLPHHLISRIVFRATRSRSRLTAPAVRWFVRHFGVDMSDAEQPDPQAYPTFNAFFTRALRPDTRPLDPGEATIVAPVDGTISQIGTIAEGRIFQAKGQEYTVEELVGGEARHAEPFHTGHFCTLYLSPRDYHRIHMPVSATLNETIYVPGRLFTVAPYGVRHIPHLFARNERMISLFNTERGPMGLILVGAINVAAIETKWAGLITPPHHRIIQQVDYTDQDIHLRRGREMGRFNMGSTVILLFPEHNMVWQTELAPDDPVKMGQRLGTFTD